MKLSLGYKALALPFAAPYGFCVPECFTYSPTTAFCISFASICPCIVVVPDCHAAEAKGPLRLSMLYQLLLKTLKAVTGQCCGCVGIKTTPASLKVVAACGGLQYIVDCFGNLNNICIFTLPSYHVQHCDAKVIWNFETSKYYCRKICIEGIFNIC